MSAAPVGPSISSYVTAIRRRHKEEGYVRMISAERAVVAAMILGVAASGCAKKDNYAADTAAVSTPAANTATASSTSTMAPDTTAKTTASTSATRKTTTRKKAPTKPSY